jgi:hypothetical protein
MPSKCPTSPPPIDFRIVAGDRRVEPVDHVCSACFTKLARATIDGVEVVGCPACGATSDEPIGPCFCSFRRGRYNRLRCVSLADGTIGVTEMDSPEPYCPSRRLGA